MAAADSTPRELVKLVLDKIQELGDKAAQEYFEVSAGTISAWKTLKTFPSIVAAQKCWDDSVICQTPEVWGNSGNVPVQVLLPIYRDPSGMNHVTLTANYRKYGIDKINIIPKFRTLIDEARNDLAHRFLQSKSEWAIFCDDDMVLPTGNSKFLHKHGWAVPERLGNRVAFDRIMSWSKEFRIIGGLYRDRRVGNRAQCERGFRSPQENQRLLDILLGKNTTDDGLEENGWVATGFVRVHRSALEEMAAEAKPGGKLADIAPPAGREKEPIGFFGRTSAWRGEDIAFGRRAGLCGIKTYTDVGLAIGHRGDKIY